MSVTTAPCKSFGSSHIAGFALNYELWISSASSLFEPSRELMVLRPRITETVITMVTSTILT